MRTPSENADEDARGRIFIDPDAFGDMARWHEVAASLRRNAPILRVAAPGWLPFWALTKHADVVEVSRRGDLFWNTSLSAPGPERRLAVLQALGVGSPPRSLVHTHGEEHAQLRSIVADWFRPSTVKRLVPSIEQLAEKFAARLVDAGGACDLARDVVVPFTLRVIMGLFGIPERDEALMLELTQGVFGASVPTMGGVTRNQEAIARFRAYFAELSAARVARPTHDLATAIALGTVGGGPLGDEERLWYYVVLATAGHDTASFALSGGIAELLGQGEQLDAMTHGADALADDAAVEMIRWTSPVRGFFRVASEEATLSGVTIPRGDFVLVSYPSANRDEEVFERPMQLDLRRSDASRHLSFGMGMHYCLGAAIARVEIAAMLRALFCRVRTIELAAQPIWSRAHFVSGVSSLPVRYVLR